MSIGSPIHGGFGALMALCLSTLALSNPILADRPRDEVRNIGTHRQLLIDDWLIERTENLRREQGQPQKHPKNPVLAREKPWEASRCELYGSVVYDDAHKRLQLFYSAMPTVYDTRLAYAESTDGGVTWVRPDLDLYPWEGKPSNIVYPGRYWVHGPSVILDPRDPDPKRRYKLFVTEAPIKPPHDHGPPGVDTLVSPDGLHWTSASENPAIPNFAPDTGNCLIWDSQREVYRAYVRVGSEGGRSIGLTESSDFQTWSKPRLVYAPSPEDRKRSWQFYGMSVTPYEDLYVGLVWIFPAIPTSSDSASHAPVTWPELVVSRDGESWSRVFFGEPFLPLGPEGSFDHRQIRTASSMVALPDRVLLVYAGSPHPHVSSHKYDIGLATIRLDGFAALRGDEREGTLLTKPLAFDVGGLRVNATVDQAGHVKAELLDAGGKVVPGYSASECTAVQGDQLQGTIRWAQHEAVPKAPSEGSRLRFLVKNARLYSFQVGKE